MELREQKAALRRQLKAQREALPAEDMLTWDSAITERVLSSEAFRQSDVVFAYHSVGKEVDTLTIIETALHTGKQVALPRCGKQGEMSFYLIEGRQDLTAGKYGIPEPAAHCAAAAATHRSLCLVPGLAFDLQGYRIGYGGGYYDRFLKAFAGTSVGLARECMLCKDLPKEDLDSAVDALVTPNGWKNKKQD